ncbi:aldolase/citrate lyase family protein [Methylomarinum sp. Ch1-1]|uniref:Aldolase/citrate lyase family protein n=1 Tax=Methylomarinum roseum TaxID=3067653 RepID=A0AAU7P0Q1_9GAMM|nr:aldolase/citrate lyase family protein [Methylomarinum sp. Ch1-1]MDP4521436.1 aldolase/citrate lyase family protein [Methylomarinum sp. Ch1-1]
MEILVAIMIEDRSGVGNLEQIFSVPGIDMVLEGAVDLSKSYGVPGQFTHPEIVQAVQNIATTCRTKRVPFARFHAIRNNLTIGKSKMFRPFC